MQWRSSVAARGEVLALQRPVGFLPNARLERFVVVQADRITRAAETIMVAPLDEALSFYASMPGAVPVSAREAGTDKKQVLLLTQIMTLPMERFSVAAVGGLDSSTRTRMNSVLRLVLEIT
jgi:mRNA-degrading endonuclease toxin of MazEF toxin-antitoxin module